MVEEDVKTAVRAGSGGDLQGLLLGPRVAKLDGLLDNREDLDELNTQLRSSAMTPYYSKLAQN